MLTSRIIFIAALLGLGLLAYLGSPWYGYMLWIIACTLPLAWGSYHIGSNMYLHVVCEGPARGPEGGRQIALTFDDGPSESFTPQILEILQREGVEAAFFCIGKQIPGEEATLKAMHEQGHIIGNHSFSHHLWFDLFSARRMQEDLRKMDEALFGAIGLKPVLFRPPYGVTNPNIRRVVARGGYRAIGWNVRSLDTVINDAPTLLKKVSKKLRPRAIVLFHDTSPATLAMLAAFIRQTKAAGYDITRLDKMCNLTPYA